MVRQIAIMISILLVLFLLSLLYAIPVSYTHLLRIRHFVEDQKPKTAVLAGGGFIGLEMAENLVEMGVSVTIVQRPKQLLAPLDADMASFVHRCV